MDNSERDNSFLWLECDCGSYGFEELPLSAIVPDGYRCIRCKSAVPVAILNWDELQAIMADRRRSFLHEPE